MYSKNYEHQFLLDGTRVIYVPTKATRLAGLKLHKQILGCWTAPDYFYHLNPGGHVAAAKLHLPNRLFVRLDLAKFFDAINRGRVHRALRRIGFSHKIAWNAACESTVSKINGVKLYSLPFGFVQSPLLASLALATSALGGALAKLRATGMTVSVYMDDILLSGNAEAALHAARHSLEIAAEISRFSFNTSKSVGPLHELEVFNLILSHANLRVTPERFAQFAATLMQARAEGEMAVVDGILGYVGTVNVGQRTLLVS